MSAILFFQIFALAIAIVITAHMILRFMAGSIDDDLEELGAKAERAVVRKATEKANPTKLKVTFDAESQPGRTERG